MMSWMEMNIRDSLRWSVVHYPVLVVCCWEHNFKDTRKFMISYKKWYVAVFFKCDTFCKRYMIIHKVFFLLSFLLLLVTIAGDMPLIALPMSYQPSSKIEPCMLPNKCQNLVHRYWFRIRTLPVVIMFFLPDLNPQSTASYC